MPIPLGAFERGMAAARRGFDRAGLAASLGQNPALRRLGFGGSGVGGGEGRESFRPPFGVGRSRAAPFRPPFGAGGSRAAPFGGAWGKPVLGGRSPFGGGMPDFSGIFEGVAWDGSGRRMAAPGFGGQPGGVPGGPTGDAAIDAAARRNGVPPAVLRALVQRESSGDWEANNRVAAVCDANGVCRRKADGSLDLILPYVGIFQSTAESWGIDWNSLIGNQAAQLDAMARIISGIKQQHGFADWGQAAAYYFAGPNSTNPGWRDEFGMSVADYQAKFNADVAAFSGTQGAGGGIYEGGGPGAGAGYGGGGWSSALWGGVNAPVTYEFNAPSVNGDMYLYGSAHGTDGWSHPGIDVGVPRGTTLYAPKAGTVSCVGWADGGQGGTGGGSCGYFGDEQGGVGNVTIRFDDGTYLIYGHSMTALVQPGQRVQAGQPVALSGGLKGDHVHFEYRVPGNCPSGYCVADPRSLGAWSSGSGGYTPAPAAPRASNGASYTPGYVIPTRIPR